MIPAVFLDRDGTLNIESEDLYAKGDVEFIAGAVEGLRRLSERYILLVVTNQGGIEAGKFTEEAVIGFNGKLTSLLEEQGIRIADVYYCPHDHRVNNCACHKPNTGMIVRAAQEHNVDLSASWMIGDKTSDVMTGKNAGLRTILLKTGYAGSDKRYDVKADFVAKDLIIASDHILKNRNTAKNNLENSKKEMMEND